MATDRDSSSAHTPGPWIIHATNGSQHAYTIYSGSRTVGSSAVAWVPRSKLHPTEANARLIAAAPLLLEAGAKVLADLHASIERAFAQGEPLPVFEGVGDLHAAIARATSESA